MAQKGASVAKALTHKQEDILRFIRQFSLENHYPPTIREIQEVCKITSTSVVDYNLKALEEMGKIHRNRKISRGIEVIERGPERANLVSLPLVGEIAAGLPLPVPDDLSAGEFDDTVEVSSMLVRGRTDDLFALRVKGQSMIDALINDGDIVVLRSAETCENGETVAVWLKQERETTLKRFYHEGDRVRLQPANSTMEPIFVPAANVAVQGKLVCVLRTID